MLTIYHKMKLYFFRNGAELSRWICAIGQLQYENVRLNGELWSKLKPTSPFGQVPMLECNGINICHTNAINIYLAKKAGIAGKDDLEQAQVQMYVELCYDLFIFFYNSITNERDPEMRAKNQKIFEEDKIPNFIQLMNKRLQEAGGKYFVGDKLTLADLQVAAFFKSFTDPDDPTIQYLLPSLHSYRTSGILDEYPQLVQHIKTVTDEPNLKEWLEKRPKNVEEPFPF